MGSSSLTFFCYLREETMAQSAGTFWATVIKRTDRGKSRQNHVAAICDNQLEAAGATLLRLMSVEL